MTFPQESKKSPRCNKDTFTVCNNDNKLNKFQFGYNINIITQ